MVFDLTELAAMLSTTLFGSVLALFVRGRKAQAQTGGGWNRDGFLAGRLAMAPICESLYQHFQTRPKFGPVPELNMSNRNEIRALDGTKWLVLFHGCSRQAFLQYMDPLMKKGHGALQPRTDSGISKGLAYLGQGMYVTYHHQFARTYATNGVVMLLLVPKPDELTYMTIPALAENRDSAIVAQVDNVVDMIVASEDLSITDGPQRCKFTQHVLHTSKQTSNQIVFFPVPTSEFDQLFTEERSNITNIMEYAQEKLLTLETGTRAPTDSLTHNAIMTKAYEDAIIASSSMDLVGSQFVEEEGDGVEDTVGPVVDEVLEELLAEAENGNDIIYRAFTMKDT
jgi:hypothetical protein